MDVKLLNIEKAKEKYGRIGEYRAVEVVILDSTKAYQNLMKDYKSITKTKSTYSIGPKKSEHEPRLVDGYLSLMRKIEYPEKCRKTGASGKVVVQYDVNIRGEVKNPKITEGVGWGCDEAVLQAVRKAEFLPGIIDGKPVQTRFKLPVRFNLY